MFGHVARDRKIKILHIVHDFKRGGIESFLYYLVQEQLNNHDIEVAILCCQDSELIINKRILDLGVKCYFIQLLSWDIRFRNYYGILQIARGYDILHFHIFKPLLSLVLLMCPSMKMFTIHSAGDSRRNKSLVNKVKKILFIKYLNCCIDYITCNSEYTKNFWVRQEGVRAECNDVVYNGVFFSNHVVDGCAVATGGEFVVGTTSRLISWKRVDYLIQAFSSFIENKKDALLIIVGEGEDKDSLQELAVSLAVDRYVVFTGYKPDVYNYQACMDVCVFPAVSEPFGLVAIECLKLGKQVVVFADGGGLTEIVEPVEPENIVANVEGLKLLLEKAYFERNNVNMSYKALRRMMRADEFSISNTEKAFMKIYISLFESKIYNKSEQGN